jgi:hypothetical protein
VRHPAILSALGSFGDEYDHLVAGTERGSWWRQVAALHGPHPDPEHDRNTWLDVWMADDRWEAALERYGKDPRLGVWPRHRAGLEAAIAGDHERAAAFFAIPPEFEFVQYHTAMVHYGLVPFLAELAGDSGAVERMADLFMATRRYVLGQRPWYAIQYLAGRLDDEAFVRQPHRQVAEADLALFAGMRLERAGRSNEAVASYLGYLAMPSWRRGMLIDPITIRFTSWRVGELSGRPDRGR